MKHGTASASTERAKPPAAVRVTPSVRGSRLSGCGSNAGGRSAAPTAPAPPKCGGEPERSFRSAGGSPLGPAPPLSERRRWPGPGLAPRWIGFGEPSFGSPSSPMHSESSAHCEP